MRRLPPLTVWRGYTGVNRIVTPARVAGKYNVPPISDSASFSSSSSVSML